MNEEKIRKMVSDSFFENIMNNLDSSIIFKYIEGLEKENQKLKKELKELEESSAKAINKQVARGIDLVNQQKEFENWLENEINRLDDYCHDYHSVLYSMTLYELQKTKEILSKFKEIVKEVE